MKEEFENKVRELISEKALESCLMSDERYEEVLQNTKEAKERKKNGLPLMPRDYRRLKRFDVVSMGCIENLIRARPSPDLETRYFCRIGDMYEILATAHHKLGHKKEKAMEMEIKKKYCNITREVINVYLDMCQTCALKKKEREDINTLKQKAREAFALRKKEKAINRALKKKEKAINSALLEEKGRGNTVAIEPVLNSRCQVDVIDMESEPDGDYKFILNYQDYLTKFVVLRPLKTKTPEEVVDVILDIFCLLGAPSILHSDNDQEFCKEVLEILAVQWKGVTLVQGRPQSESSVDLTNEDVRDSLTAWMRDNNSSKWSFGLRFVQMSKNCTYHAELKKTPHEALFRVPQKNNIFDTRLPINVAQVIKTEELEDNFPDITHSSEVTVTDAIKIENDSSEENDSEIISSPMDADEWYPKILYPEVKITPD